MKSELIVDVQESEVSAALLEDGRLTSLQKESRDIAYAVGDIYLAKVKKLMPGLNAAFINVGYEKDAFLHYLDLGPHFATYREFVKQLLENKKRVPQLPAMTILPDIDKQGSITDAINLGQELLVQIVKEPISSKGPRLTTEISFTGRFLVLTPFSDKVSVSQKIKSAEEKMRLKQLIESMKPANFGVIVRTSAEGKKSAELDNELKTLVQAFYDACEKAQRSTAPALVFEEENRVVGMLRDVFNPTFEAIHVNDADICSQIVKYVSLIAPEKRDIVKLYTKDNPIFDQFGITRQIKSSFGKTVSFKSGAYIIIEHTEALHVIDVNSGNRAKAGIDQETNALDVNLRAADEIARQLRLRDMGGIIVVDFIDMAKSEHRQELFEHMREIMANDRARHNILPLSKFGLMQITRQRVRPVLDIQVNEECPSCHGKGEVNPSILFTDMLFEKLEYIVNSLNIKGFTMYVHPYVEAYIKKGIFSSIYGSWRRQLGRVFKILPDESLAYLQFRVVDADKNVLNLIDEKDKGKSSTAKNTAKEQNRGKEETADNDNVSKSKAKQAKAEKQKSQASQKEKTQKAKQKVEQNQQTPKNDTADTDIATDDKHSSEHTEANELTNNEITASQTDNNNEKEQRKDSKKKSKAPKPVIEEAEVTPTPDVSETSTVVDLTPTENIEIAQDSISLNIVAIDNVDEQTESDNSVIDSDTNLEANTEKSEAQKSKNRRSRRRKPTAKEQKSDNETTENDSATQN